MVDMDAGVGFQKLPERARPLRWIHGRARQTAARALVGADDHRRGRCARADLVENGSSSSSSGRSGGATMTDMKCKLGVKI